MKKLLFALLSVFVMALFFASCNKYEESMYNKSDYQIKYIWYKSNSGFPNETFTYDKRKMLTNIDIVDSSNMNNILGESFEFKYNKDKTVQSISYTDGEITETVTFAYLNHYVKYMNYSINGDIRMTSNFFRDDEKAAKITRITEIYDRAFFEDMHIYTKMKLFPRFLGDCEILKEMAANNSKGLSMYCNKTITYEGDNIVKIEADYPILRKSITTVQTYSDVLNPYYGLNYCYSNDLLGFSKNAVSSKVVTNFFDGVPSTALQTDFDYTDVNKDKYPRIFTYTTDKNPGVYFKTYITYVSEYKN